MTFSPSRLQIVNFFLEKSSVLYLAKLDLKQKLFRDTVTKGNLAIKFRILIGLFRPIIRRQIRANIVLPLIHSFILPTMERSAHAFNGASTLKFG